MDDVRAIAQESRRYSRFRSADLSCSSTQRTTEVNTSTFEHWSTIPQRYKKKQKNKGKPPATTFTPFCLSFREALYTIHHTNYAGIAHRTAGESEHPQIQNLDQSEEPRNRRAIVAPVSGFLVVRRWNEVAHGFDCLTLRHN